jgi:hypothetical protein
MTTFEKHYIGKGTQVANLDIVKVVLPVEGIEAAMFEKEGIKYLGFEVAKMKTPDKFGRTHTCYYQTKVYTEDASDVQPEKQKKTRKSSKKEPAVPEEDDLPF